MNLEPSYVYRAELVTIHDGDTVTVDIDLGLRIWARRQKVRLAGLNAPELKSPEGKGEAARDELAKLLAGAIIAVQTHKDQTEKWGRWLVTIFATGQDGNQVNVNQRLLDDGFAAPMKG